MGLNPPLLEPLVGHQEIIHRVVLEGRVVDARVRELLGDDFDLKFEKGTSYYREQSGDAAWNTFSTSYGPTRSLAASLDDARRAELKRDFIAFHEAFRNDLGICVPREYLVTVGVRR